MEVQQRIAAHLCPVTSVIIYNDIAEIKRTCKVKLINGVQEIVVFGLSRKIDQKSFRVFGGSENCTLLEVLFKRISSYDNGNSKEEENFINKRNELNNRKIIIERKLISINERKEFITKFSKSLFDQKISNGNKEESLKLLEEEVFTGQVEFFNFYSQNMQPLFDEEISLQRELKRVNDEMNGLGKEKSNKKSKKKNQIIMKRDSLLEVTLNVFSEEEFDVEFQFSYMAKGVKWRSEYDLRVQGEENSLDLIHFASVSQSTGENWDHVELTVSKSKPAAVGGEAPILNTISFSLGAVELLRRNTLSLPLPPPSSDPPIQSFDLNSDHEYNQKNQLNNSTLFNNNNINNNNNNNNNNELKNNNLIFLIPRLCSISSDSKFHKIPISVLSLKANFSYFIAPKLTQSAYLKSTVVNSNIPLLAGKAKIYIDGSFVCSTSLSAANANEEFHVNLGVDPFVKVEYKDVRTCNEKSGAIRKLQTATYAHNTIIKNTKKIPISVRLIDQFPQSNDEKIRVKLVEPANLSAQNASVNSDHNIEWQLQIPAGEKAEIPFSYSVEWPLNWNLEKNFQF